MILLQMNTSWVRMWVSEWFNVWIQQIKLSQVLRNWADFWLILGFWGLKWPILNTRVQFLSTKFCSKVPSTISWNKRRKTERKLIFRAIFDFSGQNDTYRVCGAKNLSGTILTHDIVYHFMEKNDVKQKKNDVKRSENWFFGYIWPNMARVRFRPPKKMFTKICPNACSIISWNKTT